jgi:ABC-type multidrug transport system fused ATPase/permease subunit
VVVAPGRGLRLRHPCLPILGTLVLYRYEIVPLRADLAVILWEDSRSSEEPMLQARNLSVEVGGRLVVEDASFTLHPGDKAGLVGRNGAGKTSMLKVIGGESVAA